MANAYLLFQFVVSLLLAINVQLKDLKLNGFLHLKSVPRKTSGVEQHQKQRDCTFFNGKVALTFVWRSKCPTYTGQPPGPPAELFYWKRRWHIYLQTWAHKCS